MTPTYLVLLCLACVGFGAFLAAEILAIRQLRHEELIDRLSDYTLLDSDA